jgi:hypothetical protein
MTLGCQLHVVRVDMCVFGCVCVLYACVRVCSILGFAHCMQAYLGSPSSCLVPSTPSHGILRVRIRHLSLLLLAALSQDPHLQASAPQGYTLGSSGCILCNYIEVQGFLK